MPRAPVSVSRILKSNSIFVAGFTAGCIVEAIFLTIPRLTYPFIHLLGGS